MPLSVTQVDPIIDVFYVNSGRSWTFSSGTSWISDGDQWWPLPEIQAAPPRGPTIDISNFGGARCWTCRQHPQEAHRRHLQHRWWPLPDLPPVPPGGPSSRSSTSVVADVRPAASTPLGAHHRRLQLRWWLLPDLPSAPPPRRAPSTSPTSVVVAAGPTASTP
jgi:hypothetical protein